MGVARKLWAVSILRAHSLFRSLCAYFCPGLFPGGVGNYGKGKSEGNEGYWKGIGRVRKGEMKGNER